jgi:hypothetical protein
MNAASELVRILRNEQGRIGRSDLVHSSFTLPKAPHKNRHRRNEGGEINSM